MKFPSILKSGFKKSGKVNIDELTDSDEATLSSDQQSTVVDNDTAQNNKKETEKNDCNGRINKLLKSFNTSDLKVNKLVEAKDFSDLALGRSYIIGSSVSASVGSNPGDEGWINQPLRSGKKGVGSERESPVTIIVNQEYTDLLKNKPLADVRLGYDGLFKWILKQDHDLALFCACEDSGFTWVCEILYQGGEIISIKERKLHHKHHAIFDTELTELVEDVADRFPDFEIIFSASEIQLPSSLSDYRNIGDEPFSHASGIIDFGHFRITRLTILPMIFAVLGMVIYASLSMYNLNVEMQDRVIRFNKTLNGIESEYEKGSNYIKLLQSQKSLIRTEENRIEPMNKVRLILSSLSTIDGLLLESIIVKDFDDDHRQATVSIIMMPVESMMPSDQIVPVVNKLADDIGLEVGAEKAGIRNISSLSRTRPLTVATLTIKIPKV